MHKFSALSAGVAAMAVGLMAMPAWASCPGAASPIALKAFNSSPVAWIAANKGRGDVGAQALALAAAAVNSADSAFGKSLATMLGVASGDDGAAIGGALGGLAKTCSDPTDPADLGDKLYISLNIERSMLTNTAANTAYGQQTGPQTAQVVGGGSAVTGGTSASSGSSSLSDSLPTGGSNKSVSVDPSSDTVAVKTVTYTSPTLPTVSSSFANTNTVPGTTSAGSTTVNGATVNSASFDGLTLTINGTLSGFINGNPFSQQFSASGITVSIVQAGS